MDWLSTADRCMGAKAILRPFVWYWSRREPTRP